MKNTLLTLLIAFSITSLVSAQQIGDGRALEITDFTAPLKSGVYQGLLPVGMNPDNQVHGWQHLFVIRHSNDINNNQLQLSSSYAENDRLFFRKIATGVLQSFNPSWNELATRGTNNFIGDQVVVGNQTLTGNLTLGQDSQISTISGTGSGGAIQLKSNINYGGSANRYLRLGWKDNTAAFTPVLSINDDLNVGIGTTAPSSYQHGGVNKVLEVNNPGTSVNSQSHVILSSGSTLPNSAVGTLTWSMANSTASNKGVAYIGVVTGTNSTSANPSSSIMFATRNASQANWSPQMVLSDNGFLGIGTLNPKNTLDVKGTIHSQEVKVDMLDWSDFVFKKEYKLPTLEEVENHIIQKGHLENIPSEEEVVKNGINLGEMNAKLLQKIEELTLYLIQQNKQIEKQNKEMEELRENLIHQNKEMEELRACLKRIIN